MVSHTSSPRMFSMRAPDLKTEVRLTGADVRTLAKDWRASVALAFVALELLPEVDLTFEKPSGPEKVTISKTVTED